jgi:bifunctional DNA-binding transcriptional regulator/antitoxin component of YhaV-PrlF toxin-antitoxin module
MINSLFIFHELKTHNRKIIGMSKRLSNGDGISGIPKRRNMVMSVSTTIQIRGKGTVTIPVELRRKYGLDEGDVITLIDLGDGSFIFTPIVSKVARLGDRVAQAMTEERASLEEIMTALDEERERYYQERYFRD